MRSGLTIMLLLLAGCGAGGLGGADQVSDVADADVVDASSPSDGLEADSTPRPLLISKELSPEELVLPVSAEQEPALPEGVRIRAATYNLFGLNFATAAEIGAHLGTLDLDLVGLQECPGEAVEEIAEAGGFEHWFGSGQAILAKTPLVDPQKISLAAGRSFVHALTDIDGVTFSFYSAHLGWNLEGNRQCREFVDEHLALDPVPHLVLVGDFNDEHYSPQNAILEEVVSDAATVAGWYPGQRISWPSTEFDDTEGSQLIDLIFFKKAFPAIVIEVDVVNQSPVLSDHKPALAELLFPGEPDSPWTEDPLAPGRDPFRELPPEQERPANLLLNPGAEDGMSDWEPEGKPFSVGERRNRHPRTGERFFTGFSLSPGEGVHQSSASQLVDLSSEAETIDARLGVLYAAGYTSTGYTLLDDGEVSSNKPVPYDDAELVLELLDADGGLVLKVASGRRDTLGWHPWARAIPVPPGVRSARFRWIAHHKGTASSNDGAVDDLYLGFDLLDVPHGRLGGNLLIGACGDEIESWNADGWTLAADLHFIGPWGLSIFPPWTWSGKRHFAVGARPEGENVAGVGQWVLAQTVDLAPFRDVIDTGEPRLALRWGGHVRSMHALGSVRMALELSDSEGIWGSLETDAVPWAEWTEVEQLTWIPPGTTAVTFRLEADLPVEDAAIFADELYLAPELVQE